jgi:transcriptional regulator with XRE-family HTH domain
MIKIGNKLKELRLKKGLKQSDISSIANITRGAYSMIENDKTNSITIEVGKGIAKALEVPFTELFEIETINQKKETDKLKALVLYAIDKYESNQLLLRQFQFDQTNNDEWSKFDEYRKNLSEFKKGIYETLINVGFCTLEDIQEYFNWIHNRGKYAKPKPPPEPAEGSDIK